MVQGPVNRATLASHYQAPADVYDDAKTEACLEVLADYIDGNYNYAAGLVSTGALSKFTWYNVADYGAEGDGTDETTAIQNAIDAAVAAGSRIVFFPPGTYVATSLTSIDSVDLIGTNATLSVGANPVTIEEFGDRGQKPNKLNQVLYDMKKGETVTLVALGDSITAGAGVTQAEAYPSHLQTFLREYYQNNNITVINEGIGGNKVSQMIARWDTDITAHDPDMIIFMGGTNDAIESNNVDLDKFEKDVERIVSLAGSTPLLTLGITPRFKEHETTNGEGVIHFYRQVVEKVMQKHNIPYIDMFDKIHNLYKSRGVVRGLISTDGSHYTALGYKYLAEIVFTFGLANENLSIKPGQFKDMAGQWVVTSSAASSWGGSDLIDHDSLVISNSSVILYLYLEDWDNSNLVTHFVMDNSNSTTQTVDILNTDLASSAIKTVRTSPKTAGASTFFINDYPVQSYKLKPGLNRISYTTTTSVRISGFSVLNAPLLDYQEAFYDAHNNEYSRISAISTQSHVRLTEGIKAVSTSAQLDVGMIVPDPFFVTRYRIRGMFNDASYIYLGQQSNENSYNRVYKLAFDGTNAIVTLVDHSGTEYTLAAVAKAVLSTGTDLKIDLQITGQSWSVWVDGTLIYTDDITLSIGNVIVGNDSATTNVLLNPMIKKSRSTPNNTGDLIGEQWHTFTDNVLHLIDANGTERTLTYT